MAKKDGRTKGRRKSITAKQRKKLSEAMVGNKNGANGGRPIEYTRKLGKAVYGFLLAQYPIDKICEVLEISKDTFYRWKKEIVEFSDFIYQGTHGVDEAVIRSLSRKATGYTRIGVKVVKIKDDITGADRIVNHPVKEYYPPDTRAAELWMRNRSNIKERWSSIPDVDVTPPTPTIDFNNVDLSKLSDATIKEILAASKPPEPKGGAGT